MRTKIGCVGLAVCVLLVMLPLAHAILSPFNLFEFTVTYASFKRINGRLGYVWRAEGTTDTGANMIWNEAGVFTFENRRRPLGCGYTVAHGTIGEDTFQFGTASKPYHWCSNDEGALLEGDFYLNDEYVGHCQIWNPPTHMQVVRCV